MECHASTPTPRGCPGARQRHGRASPPAGARGGHRASGDHARPSRARYRARPPAMASRMTSDPVPRWATRAPRVRRIQCRGGMESMTSISVGTIDVYCVDPSAGEWHVLTLQRAHDTRCPTAWETVHGHIEAGESPEQAAVREVREETGLAVQRLYNVTVQPF